MAKISLGGFGNNIPDAAPKVAIPATAFASGGQGLQQAGEAGMRLGSIGINEERLQEDALQRAKAANTVLDREISVKAVAQGIEQDITSGAIHYNDAPSEYKRRLSELEMPNLSGVDAVTAENLQRGIKRVDFLGENSLGGVIKTARITDFKVQTEGLLDKLGKQSGLPGADVNTLNARADEIDEIGAQAYGAAWTKRKQDWKDNNWNDHLNQRAMSVRDDVKGITELQKQITEGDYADKLDSNKRNTLVARLDAYKTSLIQRNEAAASRAERLAERQLKKAEAEFNTFQTLSDKGTILSPEYIDRALTVTAGTPYQKGVEALVKQSQEVGGFAAQPVARQQALLDQIDAQIAKQGRSPELDKRREQIQKVVIGSQNDLKSNGLRAGLERGVITDLAPIDTSTPEAFAGSINKRMEQAQTVSLWAGKTVSPLDANEAESVRKMLDALPPKQKSQAVATISEAVGSRHASAIADQLDGKDKALSLAFATSGSKTTNDRYTSELILKGSTAIKDKTVMQDDKKVTGWRATISNSIDGAFSDETTAGKVKESAYFIVAGLAAENGGSVSTSDIDRAVRLAVGGSIIERNGKKLPIPAGMDSNALESRLKSISAADIMKQTGSSGSKTSDGMVEQGTIDLSKRPTVKNQDGSISTVASMSFQPDKGGPEVLIPTVVNGKVVSGKEAIDHYFKTGEHLGKFKTPEAATKYAQALHEQQATAYTVRVAGATMPVEDFVKTLPGQELLYAGPGKYAVVVRGRPVTNAAGRPIIIGVQ